MRKRRWQRASNFGNKTHAFSVSSVTSCSNSESVPGIPDFRCSQPQPPVLILFKNLLVGQKIYVASVHRREIGKLLDRVFDGSAENLMLALLKTDKVDPESIAEIKRMIDKTVRESGP